MILENLLFCGEFFYESWNFSVCQIVSRFPFFRPAGTNIDERLSFLLYYTATITVILNEFCNLCNLLSPEKKKQET